MANKSTIYKIKVRLSDTTRNVYSTLNLTIAQHPSETIERMVTRLLVYCINAEEHLTFCKGLSTPDEADLWVRSLDDQVKLWIDVGEPNPERIKKAARMASTVKVYCFNAKSTTWWNQESKKLKPLNASIFQLNWHEIEVLATLISRTIELSVTISEQSAYIASEKGECELSWTTLQDCEQ